MSNEVMSAEQSKKLAMLRAGSGEGFKSFTGRTIYFQGKEGYFYETKKDEKGLTVKQRIDISSGIILLNRSRISQLVENPIKDKKYSSREFDSNTETIELLEDGKVIASGSYQELKFLKPDMVAMERVLYVKLPDQDQVVRVVIKGTALSNFFTYINSFDAGDSSARYTTNFKIVDYSHPKYGSSKTVEFSRGAAQDIDTCLEMVMKLREAINSIEPRPHSQTTARVLPEKEAIDVDQIPF